MSGFKHTSPVGVYNEAMTKYCLKWLQFPYQSMVARTKLAAFDHNHNTGHPQASAKKSNKTSVPCCQRFSSMLWGQLIVHIP